MSAEVLRPGPVAGGGSKLGELIGKLHEYLAAATEDRTEPTLPGHWNGTTAKEYLEQQAHAQSSGLSEVGMLSSSRSRRKPAVVTKHSGMNESDASSESGAEDGMSVHSSDPDTNFLPKGTVFVLPEPVGNEARDDFRGPEFRSRRIYKQHRDGGDRRRGGYELERVNCTACGQQVNHFQRDSVYRHPMLKVLICKCSCVNWREGGAASHLEEERESVLLCVRPDGRLVELVLACDSVLESLEQAQKRASRTEPNSVRGRANKGGRGVAYMMGTGGGSVPSAGLYQRMQRFVDVTTSLSHSFKAVVQSEREEQGTQEERIGQLRIFRTVLDDLQAANSALQESLDHELTGSKRACGVERHKPKGKGRQKKGMSSQSPGLTKKLVVKLTPVPVSPQPISSTCLSIHPSPDRQKINSGVTDGALKERGTVVEIEKGMEMEGMAERGEDVENYCVNNDEEEEEEDDDEEEEEDQTDQKSLSLSEENKRSPRVKTTPRRRRTNPSTTAEHAGLAEDDSDSDEVPEVLLQTAAAMANSEEEGLSGSSSSEVGGQELESGQSSDSDDQRIKPLTEGVTLLASGNLQQSSGDEMDIQPGPSLSVEDDDVENSSCLLDFHCVQFMWDCCCESIQSVKTTPGSGCILAHCTSLGKTFQVIVLLHSVLLFKELPLNRALVMAELATVKSVPVRVELLNDWFTNGGVMIMGYEVFRTLTHTDVQKYSGHKEALRSMLLDPDHCMVNFIKENLLGSLKEFRNRFINPIQNGFVVGNGPSADWYLPFVTAADAKVLKHSGKLQLLLEILHWAEKLQDKV
ncbi:hypothetical protein cypCar_00036494 [Cyprinus carpio]|nr:hypothetical protein cypCar_00036494 [Cyprinus carpio]